MLGVADDVRLQLRVRCLQPFVESSNAWLPVVIVKVAGHMRARGAAAPAHALTRIPSPKDGIDYETLLPAIAFTELMPVR